MVHFVDFPGPKTQSNLLSICGLRKTLTVFCSRLWTLNAAVAKTVPYVVHRPTEQDGQIAMQGDPDQPGLGEGWFWQK